MATRTISALFDTYTAAASAVERLEAAGIPHGDISIVSNDPANRSYLDTNTNENPGTATGASLGTILGGGAGLLAGLGMLAIPGLGPVVAAGWLASTLVGAGVGAAAGGVVGALTDAGVSHEDAHIYAEGVNRGGTIVTARTDESHAGLAADILDADGSVDLKDRTSEWRTGGWSGSYAGTDPIVGSSPLETPVAIPPATGATGTMIDEDRRRARIYGTDRLQN